VCVRAQIIITSDDDNNILYRSTKDRLSECATAGIYICIYYVFPSRTTDVFLLKINIAFFHSGLLSTSPRVHIYIYTHTHCSPSSVYLPGGYHVYIYYICAVLCKRRKYHIIIIIIIYNIRVHFIHVTVFSYGLLCARMCVYIYS